MSLTEDEEELLEAALEKDIPKVRQLLTAGVSPNIKLTYNEYTPLHFAVHPPAHAELVQLLLGARADGDSCDKDLHTPLHDCKDPECAEILLKYGARVDLLTNDGETVLHRVANFHESCAARIPPEEDTDEDEEDDKKKKGPEINTDSLSKLSIVEGDAGCPVEQDLGEAKGSPTKIYIPPWDDDDSKQVKCAKVLLAAGEKVGLDVNARDKAGLTALHVAALGGGSAMMKLLLENGADPSGCAKNGEVSPLHRTAVAGYAQCAKVLAEAKAPVNHQDERGDTALHWAAQHGHRRFSRLLLSLGANKELRNKRGETARDVAKREGHGKLVATLGQP